MRLPGAPAIEHSSEIEVGVCQLPTVAVSPAETFSVQQLSAYLGISPKSVYSLVRRRDEHETPIPYLRLGKSLWFRKASIDAWLAAREAENGGGR